MMLVMVAVFVVANTNYGDSKKKFGHEVTDIACNWNGYDRIIIKPTDFVQINGDNNNYHMDFQGENNDKHGGALELDDNKDAIAQFVIPKGCKIPTTGIMLRMNDDCDGAKVYRNKITNGYAAQECELNQEYADDTGFHNITSTDCDMEWNHNEKYISIVLEDEGGDDCDFEGGYIELEQAD